LLGIQESISRTEERGRFLENRDCESVAGFRLRIPFMANAAHSGKMHGGGQNAKNTEVAQVIDLY
jgi:hypothetical protein